MAGNRWIETVYVHWHELTVAHRGPMSSANEADLSIASTYETKWRFDHDQIETVLKKNDAR